MHEWFTRQHEELDFLVMLDLLAVTEAALQLDYLDRVGERKKDLVSKRFRKIQKTLSQEKGPGERVHLEQHILKTWKECEPAAKGAVGDFKGALPLRHWLAHGRYWHPKMGKQHYSPYDIYDLALNLLQATSIYP